MTKSILILSLAAVFTGCGNTVDGIKQDSADITNSIIYGAKEIAYDTRDATVNKTKQWINQSAEAVKNRATTVADATK